MQRDVEFISEGTTCRGTLYLPEGGGPFPAAVMGGGWCYVKEIVLPHYAQFLVDNGIAALTFDYRNLGASEGLPRQHIDPWMQIEDYKNAVSFAETLPEVDAARIGLWGISYSGGHVLIAGAADPRVRAIVSTIPVVDGHATMRRVHGERRFAELLDLIRCDRTARYRDPDARGMLPMSSPTPDTELSTWPFPHVHEVFHRLKATEAPRHEHHSTIQSTELLLDYTVFPYVPRLLDKPTLMVVAEHDNITLWDLEIQAFHGIGGPAKKLVVLPDVTHMSLYSNRSHLQIAGAESGGWFAEHLGKAVRRAD
jgi:uncharacterized protein